jgi:hypothetical protein
MQIIDSGVTDNLENAKTGVRQGVRFLVEQQRVKILKFGITSQPKKQLQQFELDGSRYNQMFLIYRTTVSADMDLLKEYVLTTYPQFCFEEIKNEPERSTDQPSYLYCVTHAPGKL